MISKKYTFRSIRLTLLLLILLQSCNLENRVPNEFPKEKEFAQILADVHFTESVISQMRLKQRSMNDVANGCYHTVLSKYNLTQEKFDTIVSWYTAHPEIYSKVYDDVVAILTEKEATWQLEVKDIKEEIERQRALKEARNIWEKEKRSLVVQPKDTFDRRIPFNIGVDTINESGYRISAFYQFLKGNMVKEVNLEIIPMYEDSSYDTINYKIPVTFGSRKSEVIVASEDSLKILQIQGYLLKHDTDDVVNVRIKNIEFEYLPIGIDSISIDAPQELLTK
ncbi:DUF4296 domain-containing protein [Plebeiibacterium sediminum]|uniref:DUF4296 domain-containing protein n=1 Tax=Plebeiibacterium sediminum TaxID=2992112 RepID=A0AAE3SEQ7_9BACT|nr:DUF4296 domain-containing protein [Plebeiobacterium sediminum]MCW3786748.1 DUF4296 domain-containing protein [Plebeiobacterium sediminum]